MTLVRVFTDTGGLKPVNLLAKIFDVKGGDETTFFIRYLSPTDDTMHGKKIYRYEEETYQVTDESISEYMNTDDESDLGFQQLPCGGFICADSDSDYVPEEDDECSSYDDSDSEDESLEDEDDEEYYSEGDDSE